MITTAAYIIGGAIAGIFLIRFIVSCQDLFG
jgi:hypothetical protein